MIKFAALALIFALLTACAAENTVDIAADGAEKKPTSPEISAPAVGEGKIELPDDIAAWEIALAGDGVEEGLSFSMDKLAGLPGALSEGVYSVINNWPAAKFCAARGVRLLSLLEAAGLAESFQSITVRSADGYHQSFTRDQLESPRFMFPGVGEGDRADGRPVEVLLAFAYKEGSEDISGAGFIEPMLVIGQTDVFEHNNPAFVEQVTEIEVFSAQPGRWETPSSFPSPGVIPAGDTVKLQHKYFGLVKLHYTLDGSEPTALSPMYNPSTYQPELNTPIEITGDTLIKVIAVGYGKENSEVAVLRFTAGD